MRATITSMGRADRNSARGLCRPRRRSGLVPSLGSFHRVSVTGLAATLIGGYPIFKEAFENIVERRITMELLGQACGCVNYVHIARDRIEQTDLDALLQKTHDLAAIYLIALYGISPETTWTKGRPFLTPTVP